MQHERSLQSNAQATSFLLKLIAYNLSAPFLFFAKISLLAFNFNIIGAISFRGFSKSFSDFYDNIVILRQNNVNRFRENVKRNFDADPDLI